MNEQIEMTKQAFVAIINNSELPIGVVNLIVKDISVQLDATYKQVLATQKAAKTKEEAGE